MNLRFKEKVVQLESGRTVEWKRDMDEHQEKNLFGTEIKLGTKLNLVFN